MKTVIMRTFFLNFILFGSIMAILSISSCKKTEDEKTPPLTTNTDNSNGETFTDNRDGKVYQFVKIGNQIWMAENLAFKVDTGGCWAYNNDENNIEIYGYLYNWWTAMEVAPTGWHVPTEMEWTELINYLGGDSIAGVKMKESGTVYWKSPNNATNSSGFTALPSGFRTEGAGICLGMYYSAHWWCSTEYAYDNNGAFAYSLDYSNSKVSKGINYSKLRGHSIRCIKD